MVKIDLITGFLGAGKTTFIKKYAEYLCGKGERICILENDFGAVNVDMMLLGELRNDNCELEMVSGGCDADCHRRRFKTKLISMGMCGYDRVLVEPSGIYDIDEFFDALFEEPLDRWYQIENVIAVVSAKQEEHLSAVSEYLLASECASAGILIFSRMDMAREGEVEDTIKTINSSLESAKCDRVFTDEYIAKKWDEYCASDFEKISACGYKHTSFVKLPVIDENKYSSLYFMNIKMDIINAENIIKRLFEDRDCGDIYRIKGFLAVGDESWIEINATATGIHLSESSQGQEVIIVIGENLVEDKINAYWNGHRI